jgi:hypothetical protein
MVSIRRIRRPKRGTCPGPGHARKEGIRKHSFLRLNASLLLIYAGVVAAQEKSEPGAQILRQEIKRTEAYKHRNINILSSLLADDFVEVAELSDLKVRMPETPRW